MRAAVYPCHMMTTYTRTEVAELLKVSLSTVGNLITSGQLFAVRIGSMYRVPDYAVQDFLAGRPPRGRDGDPLTHDDSVLPTTPSLLTETGED